MKLSEIAEKASQSMLALKGDEFEVYDKLMDELEDEDISYFKKATPQTMSKEFGLKVTSNVYEAIFWYVAEMNEMDYLSEAYEGLPDGDEDEEEEEE